jgi:SAM-dependent methyltransferase
VTLTCRICGNREGNRLHRAREMMFGLREEFDYVECADCGCLQIAAVPEDLGRFYPADYYAHLRPEVVPTNPLKTFLRLHRAAWAVHRRDLLGAALCRVFGEPEFYPTYAHQLRKARVGFHDAILDLGCGSGTYLLALESMGFRRLLGADPYLPGDTRLTPGVILRKQEPAAVQGSFDFVAMHHAFEHVADPAGVLAEARRLLKPGGRALIRIPVFPSHAWRVYGVDWVQLDAPRHLFLHSVESMRRLAAGAGLEVLEVEFDSTEFQFSGSERYRRDLPLCSPAVWEPDLEQSAEWARLVPELNAAGEGDQAAFYLRRP